MAEILFKLDSPREIRTYDHCPILFVHGTVDTPVPPDGTEEMYAAYAGPKELMLLEGQPHGFLLEPGCEAFTTGIVDWVIDQQPSP